MPYPADDVQADNRRGKDFEKVRAEVVAEGGRRLLLDHLRHSAATHAVDSGASVDDTTALTLHKNKRVLEKVYVQLTEAQAIKVQRARGIIP